MADPNMSTEGGPVEAKAPTGPIPKWTPPVDPRTGKKAKFVPVWDPEERALRAATPEQATELAKAGWTVGGDAQNEALNHSPLARVAAGTMAFSNAMNAGATDAFLSHSADGKQVLKASNKVREDNKGASFAGSLAGIAATGALGGFAGGLTKGMLEGAAARGTAAKLGAQALDIGLQGAPYMAIQGAMDTVTEDNLLNHPITVQQIAANSFHSVIEGAGINLVTHGIVHAPGGIRKAFGNSLDHLEKWGALPREMEEVPAAAGTKGSYTTRGPVEEKPIYGPWPKSAEEEMAQAGHVNPAQAPSAVSVEHAAEPRIARAVEPSIEDLHDIEGVDDGPIVPHTTDLSSEMAAPAAKGDSPMVGKLSEIIDGHPAPNMSEIAPEPLPPMAEAMPDLPEPAPIEPMEHIPPHYPEYQPPIPMPRKPMREPAAIATARAQVAKYGTAAELAEFDAAVAKEAAENAPKGEKPTIGRANGPEVKAVHPPDLKPEDIDFHFKWEKGADKQAKLERTRLLMKQRMADAHPDALKKWKKVRRITREIDAVKAEKNFPNRDAVLDAKYDAKEALKHELEIMVPREIDETTKRIKPGFRDYNDEYRRIVRGNKKSGRDIGDPIFEREGASEAAAAVKAEADAAEIHAAKVAALEAKTHAQALKAADAAEGAVAEAQARLAQAEAKLQRLEADFELKKNDADTYHSQVNERAEKLALRKHEARIKAIEARERAALTRIKERGRIAEAKANNARELKAAKMEIAAKKEAAQAEARAAKEKARAQEKADSLARKEKADAERKKERESKAAAREAARAEAKAAREAEAAQKEKAREARRAADKAEKQANEAKKHAERAAKQAEKDRANAFKSTKAKEDQNFTTEKEVRKYSDHEGHKTETTERHIYKDKIRQRVTIKIDPHAESPTYRPGKYKVRFSGSDFSNVAKAAFYTGMYGPAKVAAGAMGAHNTLVHLANNRKAIGEAWQKFVGGLAKGVGTVYQIGKRAQKSDKGSPLARGALSPKRYQEVAETVGYLSENPEAIVSYTQQTYPNLARTRPELLAQIAMNIQQGIYQINQAIPKKPFRPTLQNAGFQPTRAQQVAVMKMWQAMGNPELAIAYGDHTVFNSLDKVYPDLQDSGRQQIIQHIQNSKTPIRGRKARQFSQFIRAPVRPNDDPAALKRLQQTAGPEPMKKGGGGGGFGGGPKSAKITNQAVSREATGSQLAQMGN